MSTDWKKSMGWTAILILLGVFAFYSDSRWLIVLVPAAIVVYYGVARSKFSAGGTEGSPVKQSVSTRALQHLRGSPSTRTGGFSLGD